jgi:hypothetical protein
VSDTSERDKYRDVLIKGRDDAENSYDEWIMKLSGGALAIALGFARIGGQPQQTNPALVASWVLFTLSLLLMLFSFKTSHDAYHKALAQLDENRIWRETPGGRHAKTTAFLNYAAGASLVVGLIFFAFFAATNPVGTNPLR